MTAKIVQFATVQGPHGPALVLLREDGQLSGQVSAGPLIRPSAGSADSFE